MSVVTSVRVLLILDAVHLHSEGGGTRGIRSGRELEKRPQMTSYTSILRRKEPSNEEGDHVLPRKIGSPIFVTIFSWAQLPVRGSPDVKINPEAPRRSYRTRRLEDPASAAGGGVIWVSRDRGMAGLTL